MKNVRSLLDRNLVERLNSVDNLSDLIYRATKLSPDQHQIWAIRDRRSLTLMTYSQMLATQLRFQQESILDYIRRNSSFVFDKINIKLSMPSRQQQPKKAVTYQISERNSRIIAAIADTIEDEDLRESLKRIAHVKRDY